MSARPLSALVLTYNEEKKIGACLQSLAWVDEIVVVDAHSTDRTREICLREDSLWASKIRVIEHDWSGFRDQRNFSLEQARNAWVLVVDADEICTPELEKRLKLILESPEAPERSAYKIHRREFFQGKPIFYGMWNPSYQDRFFDRTGVKYINEVHEYPVFMQPPGLIHESLLHQSDLTVERYMEKLNRYTTLEALDRYQQGQRTTRFKLVGAFPAHAFKSFFYYQAYKDGIHGLVISLLEGVSRVVRQIKIWQLMQRNRD
jgi:glycosyltransferase involved in cell wall biosynthesis